MREVHAKNRYIQQNRTEKIVAKIRRIWYTKNSRARWGVSGALYLQSAIAERNYLSRGSLWKAELCKEC